MGVDWKTLIVGQLEFYWDVHLHPRLEGLSDEEYLWKPVPDAWTVQPDEAGNWVMDGWRGGPAQVTTIAWRMMHIAATGLVNRASAFFGEDPFPGLDMNDWHRLPTSLPSTASEAIAFLEQAYATWHGGIASLDIEALEQPLGPKGGQYADDTMAALIIHINREVMHHGGEIGLLRDLYRDGVRKP
jgi:hypothetical protein